MSREALRTVANLARSLAGAIESLAPVERQLRVLADQLEPDDRKDLQHKRGPRGPAEPQPTVQFSDVDAKKAERALARIGVRRPT